MCWAHCHELDDHLKNILITEGCSCSPESLSAPPESHSPPGTHSKTHTARHASHPAAFLNIDLTTRLNNVFTLFSRFSELPAHSSLSRPGQEAIPSLSAVCAGEGPSE